MAKEHGLVLPNVPNAQQSARVFVCALAVSLSADAQAHSVGHNLRALRQAAQHVRERLSQEQRHLIERTEAEFARQLKGLAAEEDLAVQAALEALDRASELLSAITGAQTDRMMRDDGWRMLSIGRHIERLATLSHALASGLQTGAVFESGGFEAVLAFFDSTITFRAHYQQRRDLVALLDMLMTQRDNPRSLAWVLSTLRARLLKLPPAQSGSAAALLDELPDPERWDLIALSAALDGPATPQQPPPALLDELETCAQAAYALSDRLGHAYFSHAERVNRSFVL